jgi:hypothetical protein
MKLSFQNISELVFYDSKVKQLLPESSKIFDKWILGHRAGISAITKDAELELINSLTQEQIDKLSKYWGEPVTLQRLDSCLVKNIRSNLESMEKSLQEIDYKCNIILTRGKDYVYISCWR